MNRDSPPIAVSIRVAIELVIMVKFGRPRAGFKKACDDEQRWPLRVVIK
jgi:hypothetical protein